VTDKEGRELPHYAIITTEANALMAPVHNRMPVVIEKADEHLWVEDGLEQNEI
jgi:putative SOS response-associated peptidase YedK